MVPHISIRAKSKKYLNISSADIVAKGWQFLDKSAQLNRIRHHPLKASQTHRLPAMARLCGRHWQQFHCFNTNAHRRQPAGWQRWPARRSRRQRCLSCAISEYTYNMRHNPQRAPYTAQWLIRTAPHTQRNSYAALAPNRKLQLTLRTAWNDWCSRLNCKQPPSQTVVLVADSGRKPFPANYTKAI